MSKEAMQRALGDLFNLVGHALMDLRAGNKNGCDYRLLHILETIEKQRAELATPDDKEQPVTWLQRDAFGNLHAAEETWHGAFPVYAAPQPPAEQGAELSDDQIKKIVHVGMQRSWSDTRIARELIAADRKARGGAA